MLQGNGALYTKLLWADLLILTQENHRQITCGLSFACHTTPERAVVRSNSVPAIRCGGPILAVSCRVLQAEHILCSELEGVES